MNLSRVGSDFNLTLKQCCMGELSASRSQDDPLRSCEFDVLVINLSSETFSCPFFDTGLTPGTCTAEPAPLGDVALLEFPPFKPRFLRAYADLVDLDCPLKQTREERRYPPCLIIHSASRGEVGWLFERTTGAVVGQIDNQLNVTYAIGFAHYWADGAVRAGRPLW